MKRILLTISYDGTHFNGWQHQNNGRTVQDVVEKTIKDSLKEDIRIFASGRTDEGVHAIGQKAHFDTNSKIASEKIANIINLKLPEDVSILKSEEVSNDFDARKTAKRKTYRYDTYISYVPLPLKRNTHARVFGKFDFDAMKKAVKYFEGTHDFAAFRNLGSTAKTTVRTIYKASFKKISDTEFSFEFTGDGFLYHMVRIMVGTLYNVGRGKIKPEEINDILKSKNRKRAGKTAPSQGLYLVDVKY